VPEGYEPDEPVEHWAYSRADFLLLRRACRKRWGVPDELRTDALLEAWRVLRDPLAVQRDKLAAMKFILAADLLDAKYPVEEAAVETRPRLIIPGADPRILSLPAPDDDQRPEGRTG
jgi:hypothetical protein